MIRDNFFSLKEIFSNSDRRAQQFSYKLGYITLTVQQMRLNLVSCKENVTQKGDTHNATVTRCNKNNCITCFSNIKHILHFYILRFYKNEYIFYT
jgi:hypothetical protein